MKKLYLAILICLIAVLTLSFAACADDSGKTVLDITYENSSSLEKKTIYFNEDHDSVTLNAKIELEDGNVKIIIRNDKTEQIVWEKTADKTEEFETMLTNVKKGTRYIFIIEKIDQPANVRLSVTSTAKFVNVDNTTSKMPGEEVFKNIEGYFDIVVNYLILIIEFIGIVILVYAIVSAVIGLCKRQKHVRLKLAEGIALALEFKMGGELLRTVIVREWNELLILGAIILLRAALTFLIQWEIKIERKNGDLTDLELHDIKTPLTNDLNEKKSKSLFKKAKAQNAETNTKDETNE